MKIMHPIAPQDLHKYIVRGAFDYTTVDTHADVHVCSDFYEELPTIQANDWDQHYSECEAWIRDVVYYFCMDSQGNIGVSARFDPSSSLYIPLAKWGPQEWELAKLRAVSSADRTLQAAGHITSDIGSLLQARSPGVFVWGVLQYVNRRGSRLKGIIEAMIPQLKTTFQPNFDNTYTHNTEDTTYDPTL